MNRQSVQKTLEIEHQLNKDDDFVVDTSFTWLLYSIFYLSAMMYINFILLFIRYFLLYFFLRKENINVLEAVGACIPSYQIITVAVFWAFSQGFSFKAAQFYSVKEYRNLGQILYKALLFNIAIGLVLFVILFFFGSMIFSTFLNNQDALEKLNLLIKALAIGTPFHACEMITSRYYSVTNDMSKPVIGSIIGLAVQIVLQLVLVSWFGLVEIGTGLSFSIGTISNVCFGTYCFFYKNPIPEVIIPFSFDEVYQGFWNFIQYSLPLGLLALVIILSVELMQFLALAISEYAFTCYAIIYNIFMLVIMYVESLTLSNNIHMNYAIANKRFDSLYTTLNATLLLVAAYLVLVLLVLLFFFEQIVTLYTFDSDVLRSLVSLKFWVILVIIFFFGNSLFAEGLSVLGSYMFPIVTTIVMRYIFYIALSLVLSQYFGLETVLISNLVCLVLCNIFNGVYFLYLMNDLNRDDYKREKVE